MSKQPGTLHLRPRSNRNQRIWVTGAGAASAIDPGAVRLKVRPGDHRSFSTLYSILDGLKASIRPERLPTVARLEGHLENAGAAPGESGRHGSFMVDAVAFAVMRRISRESVHTARIIDLAAQLLIDILSDVAHDVGRHLCVIVEAVDEIDRPSLKVLARSVLLLSSEAPFSWMWFSKADPFHAPPAEQPDVATSLVLVAAASYGRSRQHLLLQIAALLDPQIEIENASGAQLPRPRDDASPHSLYEIGAALVQQNYDACFLWAADPDLLEPAADRIEAQRLLALAAINVGEYEAASGLLESAQSACEKPGRQAHLCYLQGLLKTKRTYDLSASDSHFYQGLQFTAAYDSTADQSLERAWLLNGLALNEAVRWRKGAASAAIERAFELERLAFTLVAEGDDPARTYLRFNLIANSAFLLEMQGEYDHAIRILLSVFDIDEGSPTANDRGRCALDYRIALLHYRAHRYPEARDGLEKALSSVGQLEDWPMQERILRALGTVTLADGRSDDAEDYFAHGLRLCLAGRSAEGALEHARGIALANGTNNVQRLNEDVNILIRGEGLEGVQELPRPLSSKLPAYFPEIDLEEIPAIDVNRFLSHDGRSRVGGPWT